VVIEYNVITGNAHNGINADGAQRITVRGNIIASNARSGVRAYVIDGAAGPLGWKLINNNIVGNAGWAVKFSEDLAGHVLFNNLLFASSGTGSLCVGTGAVQSDFNRFDGPLSRDEEASTMSFTAWRTATSRDANSALSTAAANFQAAANFRLLMSAPARNSGTGSFGGSSAPSIDLDGTPRPRGVAVDVGAYEFIE